jgi:uroporphyrinogen decarboxylase
MTKSDRFLRACRREVVDCTPVWLMRQAGRYMEEYRLMREKHGFLEMCRTPELAAEVTMQPIRRFDLDAAIIFSDILLPLESMGVRLSFGEGGGPVIENRVASKQDVLDLKGIDPETDLVYVMKAMEMARDRLEGSVPLIGFCGAPFTLASYLIEGGGSKYYKLAKGMMHTDESAFHLLMEKLTDMAALYVNAQVRHGAQAIQVFDSWVGILSTTDYRAYVLPHMLKLFSSIDKSVPSIHFGVGTFHLLPLMEEAGGDVIGVDWRTPIDEARALFTRRPAVQGNLDPTVLFTSFDYIEGQVKDILARVNGSPGHIFNLGHGILPDTPVENVDFLISSVHRESKRFL